MALPHEKKHVRIIASSLWALLLCVLIRVCMMVFSLTATILGSDNVLFAAPAAVVGLQHGGDWICDTGAAMNLIGKQDTVNITEQDKMMRDPPLRIDTASGKAPVDFSVEAYCKPLDQTVTPLVMADGTPKVISTGI